MDISRTSSDEKRPGTVVAFYSFKGGVGRSMALANVAVLLARAGRRVLCIDWDLEAPGLDRYFRAVPRSAPKPPSLSEPARLGGLLDILEQSTPEHLAPWRDHLRTRTAGDGSRLDCLGSGEDGTDYSARLADFNWTAFYETRQGGDIVEALRDEWKAAYDFVLVDSRTGLTDSSGICTIQMPDLLVLLFAANRQNTGWSGRVARGVRQGRRELPYARAFLPIIPVLARFDTKEESDRAAESVSRSTEHFKPFFADWLPRSIDPRDMVLWGLLPYVPRYSFEEALAVEDEPTTGPEGLTFRYQLLSDLIQSRFQGVRAILAGAGVPGAALPAMLPSASDLRAELRQDSKAIQRRRDAILARAEEEPLEAAEALEVLAEFATASVAESLLGEAIRILENPAVAQFDDIPYLMGLQAAALAKGGRKQEAEMREKSAILRAMELFGEYDWRTGNAHLSFAYFLQNEQRKSEAAEQLSLAVAAHENSADPDPDSLRVVLEEYRDQLNELGRWREMVPVARRVLELVMADESSSPAEQAWALDRLASALQDSGDLEEAEEHFRTALRLEEQLSPSGDSPGISRAFNNLALVLCDTGRHAEAEPLFRRALAPYETTLGPEHPYVATTCRNLASVLRDTGRYAEAEPLFRRALAIREKALGPDHPDLATACGNLALVLHDTGHYAEAEPLFRRALAIDEKVFGPEHLEVGIDLVYLAQTLSESGNAATAEPSWQRGLALLEKGYGRGHHRVGRARWHYAEHLERTGRIAEARTEIAAAVDILTQALGAEHPDTIKAREAAARIEGIGRGEDGD